MPKFRSFSHISHGNNWIPVQSSQQFSSLFFFSTMQFLVHLRPRNLYLNVVVFGLEGLLLFRNFGQMR